AGVCGPRARIRFWSAAPCRRFGRWAGLAAQQNRVSAGMCLARRFFLPLLPPREERAGERRAVFRGIPLSPALSPFVPHGEREFGARAKELRGCRGRNAKSAGNYGLMGLRSRRNRLLLE